MYPVGETGKKMKYIASSPVCRAILARWKLPWLICIYFYCLNKIKVVVIIIAVRAVGLDMAKRYWSIFYDVGGRVYICSNGTNIKKYTIIFFIILYFCTPMEIDKIIFVPLFFRINYTIVCVHRWKKSRTTRYVVHYVQHNNYNNNNILLIK